MKVKINKVTKEQITVDVDLPIYRQQDLDSCTSYMKVFECENGELVEHDITISHSGAEVEIEIDRNYSFGNSGMDYSLGQGIYKCSEAEFNKAALNAKAILDEIATKGDIN